MGIEGFAGANGKPGAVDPLLKENALAGSELEVIGADFAPNGATAGCVAELVTAVVFEAPN